jgi:ATP-binding protein involved in chromosome partitioning
MAAAELTREAVEAVLKGFNDPETGRDVLTMQQVRDLNVSGKDLSLTLELTSHSAPLHEETRSQLIDRLREKLPGVDRIEIQLAPHVRPPQKLGEIGLTAKSVIAVGSGKGGVGKSTVAATLAYGLQRAGCEVGLVDADVYGPSIPHLLGVNQRPEVEDKRFKPVMVDGIRVMSMGFLVPPEEAVVWRGPMLHGAITQFIRDTAWGDLDYLIIDMPPGTGDVALTLSQLLPLSGAVVVCTPQDVALLDAVKAVAMFRKVNIPILGMVENMSYFICPDNGKRYEIFGSGGAKQRAGELEIPFLGEIPINIQLRIHGDEGRVNASFEDKECASYLEAICLNLARNLAREAKQAPPMPTLSVLR